MEGQVQGGQTREQEPEIPLGSDDGKPESLEGRSAGLAKESPGGNDTIRAPDKKTHHARLPRPPMSVRATWCWFGQMTWTFPSPGTNSRWAWWRAVWRWCSARECDCGAWRPCWRCTGAVATW